MIAGLIAAVGTLAAIATSVLPVQQAEAVYVDMRGDLEAFFSKTTAEEIKHVSAQLNSYEDGALVDSTYTQLWTNSIYEHVVYQDIEGSLSFLSDMSGERAKICAYFPEEEFNALQLDNYGSTDFEENGACEEKAPRYYIHTPTYTHQFENMRIETEEDTVFLRFESTERFYSDVRMASLAAVQKESDTYVTDWSNASEDHPDHLRYLNKQEDGMHKHSFELPVDFEAFDSSEPIYIQMSVYADEDDQYTAAYIIHIEEDSIRELDTTEIADLQYMYDEPTDGQLIQDIIFKELIAVLSTPITEPRSQTWETWGIVNEIEVLKYNPNAFTYDDGEQYFEEDEYDEIQVYKLGTNNAFYGIGFVEDGEVTERILLDVAEVILGEDVDSFFSEQRWKERSDLEFNIQRTQ